MIMGDRAKQELDSAAHSVLSNADIADRLASLTQFLSSQQENPYKIKAYQRAAGRIRDLSESLDELVRDGEDLTQFPGIGAAIASAIREIVTTGTLGKLQTLRGQATPALADMSRHPRLDPKRVMRIYKKLCISSVEELRGRLESGEIAMLFGSRMEQHIRRVLPKRTPSCCTAPMTCARWSKNFSWELAPYAAPRWPAITGVGLRLSRNLSSSSRRRIFPAVVARMQRYGGRTALVTSGQDHASFSLCSGILLRLQTRW
jgi:DNA polymerase (family 10)